jgi:hypothetical protein
VPTTSALIHELTLIDQLMTPFWHPGQALSCLWVKSWSYRAVVVCLVSPRAEPTASWVAVPHV